MHDCNNRLDDKGDGLIYTLNKIVKNLLDFKLWLGAFATFAIPFGFFILFKWIRGQIQTKD